MKQSIHLVFKNKFNKNYHVTIFFQFILILLSMPLSAETRYLFPGDIIDKAKLDTYNSGRENRYMTQRNWFYHDDIRKIEKRKVQQPKVQKILSHQARPNYDSSRYIESARYNYKNYPSQPLNYRYADSNPDLVPYALRDSMSGIFRESAGVNRNYFDNPIYVQSRKPGPLATPTNTGDQYRKKYPDLLYVTDVERSRRSIYRKNNVRLYKFSNQGEYPQTMEKNRSIPMSVYNLSRIQPAFQNYPLTGFGIFPQQSILFD